MARAPITRLRAEQLAACYGVTTPGWHLVACHWCGTWVSLKVENQPPGLKVIRWTALRRWLGRRCRRGGTNDLANLVFACGPCNASRGNQHQEPPRLQRIRRIS